MNDGVTTKEELSHIKYDENKKLWSPEFHLTLIRAGRKPLDVLQLVEDFGKTNLGIVRPGEVHISSRGDFETPDGDRRQRNYFRGKDELEATFACESKISLI